DARNFLTSIEKQVGHARGLIEITAAVSTKVNDEAFCALADESLGRGFELICRCLVELLQRDIADVSVEQDCEGDCRDTDIGAGERHRDWLCNNSAEELHRKLGSGDSLESVGCLPRCPATSISGIDRYYAIAFHNTGLLCRS